MVVLSLLLGGPVFASAQAQVVWDAPNVIVPQAKFGSNAKIRPEVWPRLDVGAVLCKSEEDLLRLAAYRRGEPGAPPSCQVIRSATPITIVRRAGPGRTEVSVTDQDLNGWTDAWLPEKAPLIGGKGVVIR
jgi:hypothetical protein